MQNDPDSGTLTPRMLVRVGLAGLLLGTTLVGLFVLVWNVMGSMGVADFPRLFAAVCVPPALLSAIIGFALLVLRPPPSSMS